MKNDKLHLLEVERNGEGSTLAYLSPTDKDGTVKSGYRLAGPKAWGGSRNLAKLKVSSCDLVAYIKQYAPEVLKELRKESKDK